MFRKLLFALGGVIVFTVMFGGIFTPDASWHRRHIKDFDAQGWQYKTTRIIDITEPWCWFKSCYSHIRFWGKLPENQGVEDYDAIATGVIQYFKGRSRIEREAIAFLRCGPPRKLYWSDMTEKNRRDREGQFYSAKLIDSSFKPKTKSDKIAVWQAGIILKRFCKN